MATYPRVTPATLINFAVVIDDPTAAEDANKGYQVDLQTRRFIYDFLSSKFDLSTGLLLGSALGSVSIDSKINGSTSNSGTERQIVQGTVSTPDLRNAAVTTAKIDDLAVTTGKLGDSQVTVAKLADDAVETAKIKDDNVTTAKVADDAIDADKLKDDATGAAGAVTEDHIRTDAVTTAKIKDNAVNGQKLILGTNEADILVAAVGTKEFTPVALSGDATISAAGVLTLATKGIAVIQEVAANAVPAGDSVAGAAAFTNFNIRGVTIDWTKLYETIASMVTVPGASSGKFLLAAGSYLIEVSVPACTVGLHLARLSRYDVSDALQESFYGSSESSSGANCSSRSLIYTSVVTAAANDYFKVEHWTETAATDGLGKATSAGGMSEIYAIVKIQKVS